MNKQEEILIILKRIPEQRDYLRRLYYKEVLTRHEAENYGGKKEWERVNQLIESAEGVFDNLIERLNELICQNI